MEIDPDEYIEIFLLHASHMLKKITRGMDNLKKFYVELQEMKTHKMKTKLHRNNKKLHIAEERIKEVGDRVVETIQNET